MRRPCPTARETPPWPLGDRDNAVVWRLQAEQDFAATYLHLGESSVRTPRDFAAAVATTLDLLLSFPGAGRACHLNAADSELRSIPVRGFASHLLFYRPTPDGIEIIRLLHGARDLPRLFDPSRP